MRDGEERLDEVRGNSGAELRYRRSGENERRCGTLNVQRHHYLGHQHLPGAQLRYFVHAAGEIVAVLRFGVSAWSNRALRPSGGRANSAAAATSRVFLTTGSTLSRVRCTAGTIVGPAWRVRCRDVPDSARAGRFSAAGATQRRPASDKQRLTVTSASTVV
jgi:hypothetical protein